MFGACESMRIEFIGGMSGYVHVHIDIVSINSGIENIVLPM